MVLALNMTWTHCEFCWNLDFEPSETSGGQPVALGASVFGQEIFCGNASHPVVAFVSVVAFCGLLWFVTSRCFCMMVCGAKCHFYGHCRILWYL